MTKEEILTKEIDLIQGCINRMAQNSFMIKGWCITIVTALIAFLDKNINAFILGFIFIIPILAFWYLDSFFLLTERLYRRKYEWVIKNRLTSDEKFFDLNPNSFKDVKKDKEIKIMFSKTLRWFYLMLLGTVLLVTIIIGFSQNKKQLAEQGKTKAQIEKMIDETGCDAVMIGRACLGNPWIIKETVDYLEKGIIPKEVSLNEKIDMIKKHTNLLIETKNEKIAILEMRANASWYLKGIKGGNEIRRQITSIKTKEDLFNILDRLV